MFLAVPVPEARVGAECQACGPGGSGWDRTAVSPGPPQRLPSRPRVLSAGLCERRAFRTRAAGQHRGRQRPVSRQSGSVRCCREARARRRRQGPGCGMGIGPRAPEPALPTAQHRLRSASEEPRGDGQVDTQGSPRRGRRV